MFYIFKFLLSLFIKSHVQAENTLKSLFFEEIDKFYAFFRTKQQWKTEP